MSALRFSLRAAPDQRLDLAPLVPHRLAGLSAAEIEHIELHTTRAPLRVGDIFRLSMGDAGTVQLDGHERFDRVGSAMINGEIRVEGDVGMQAGRLMRGGRLVIAGNAGPWAGSGLKGGVLDIGGNAGDRLGGPIAGEVAGMRGGILIVRGNAGEFAGDRLRRGTIVIEGDTGNAAGSRMIAGTLVIGGNAGAMAGVLMARGTIVLARGCKAFIPTFTDSGVHDLVATTLMARYLEPHSPDLAKRLRAPWRRLLGDMAVTGRGEILCLPA
ncbi:MAG TPA: formylmethanofuran dehydrogenase subunit C [Pseudolabrys sp.]|nr:formylmethanofuran dehydrogenase subunit C [Pseudolabrys sp.]